jgi:hypothetical protein
MTRPRLGHSPGVRLQRHLQVIECRYPRAWEQIDTIRRLHAAAGLWPAWCHIPLVRVRDIVCPEEAAQDPTRLVDVAIVTGLAAWRVHKAVCPVERTSRAMTGPFDLGIPPDHLHALLDRPVYLELPSGTPGSPATGPTRGALVHLTQDDPSRAPELRLLLEPTRRWTLGSVPLVPLAVPLTEATLTRCLDAVVRDHVRRHERLARYAVAGELAVSLHGLLCLCLGLTVQLLDPTRLFQEALADLDPDAVDPAALATRKGHASPIARRIA